MDPVTAVGTASAVLSLAGIIGKVVTTAIDIHTGGRGATKDNLKFEETINRFKARLRALSTKLSATASYKGDAANELKRSAARCKQLGDHILKLLAKTKANRNLTRRPNITQRKDRSKYPRKPRQSVCLQTDQTTLVESIRAAWQTVWQKEKVNKLKSDWEVCITKFEFALSLYVLQSC